MLWKPVCVFAASVLALIACDTVGFDVSPDPEPVADADAWDEMLDAVNEVRSRGATCGSDRMPPAGPVIWDRRLERAAEDHSEDMADSGRLGHEGSNGLSTGARVRRAGYDWRVVAENLARGQRSVDEVIGDWVSSPSHCRQIMDARLQEMGAAEVDGYWTQVFGVSR